MRLALGAMAVGLCMVTGARKPADVDRRFHHYANAGDTTPNETVAIMTVQDLVGEGVSVDVSLDKAIYFASTGGPHITFAFNLDPSVSISFNDLLFSNPLKSDFTFALNKNAGFFVKNFYQPVLRSGDRQPWCRRDLTIADLHVSIYQNAKAIGIVDVLLHGTGEAGATGVTTTTTSIAPSVPEPSTWDDDRGFAGKVMAFRHGRKESLSPDGVIQSAALERPACRRPRLPWVVWDFNKVAYINRGHFRTFPSAASALSRSVNSILRAN
jgi:hypothetical protein